MNMKFNYTIEDVTESTTLNSSEGFIVKVPTSEVTSKELSIKVNVTVNGKVYKAYQYNPADSEMQAVTPGVIEPTEENISASINLGLVTSKVVITKYDSTTDKPLPGAKLVLKDSDGDVITSWTSTNKEKLSKL